ncbi:MAG: hypothetical protein ABI628_06195 [Chloroflexota bacterium]
MAEENRTAAKASVPAERLQLYDRLIAAVPGVVRKGASMPYTSVNGHMFSYLYAGQSRAPPAEQRSRSVHRALRDDPPIVLLVVGLLGGLGRRLALLAVIVFGLFILQSVFVAMRTSAPTVAALHPVNGFLILLLALLIAHDSWAARARADRSLPGASWPDP